MKGFVVLAPNVYRLAVPFTGCWTGVVLVTGKENVLIDSGGSAETMDSCIVPALREMGLEPEDISYLALTHTHGDHIGGASRLCELAPKLRVAAFAASKERVRDPLGYSRAIRARFPNDSPLAPAGLRGVEPDLLLEDGERIGSLRLLHTPGHDTDSCCYLDERTATLITGDSLQLNGTASQGCSLLMDAVAYGQTLERLMCLPIENIVCGHPYLPLGAEAIGREASCRYLAECLKCHAHDEGFVAGMMAAGEKHAHTIARRLIEEVKGTVPAYLFLPLHTVEEYMKKRRKEA